MNLLRPTLACLPLLVACGASRADNCDAIGAQIDARIRATGTVNFTLTTLDSGAATAGKVVGSCAQGTRKIVYQQAGAGAARAGPPASAASAAKGRPAKRGGDGILTECKDGSVSVGGDCKK